MTEQKFNEFMTCLVSDKKLRRFMEDLIDCGVLEIIDHPVQVRLHNDYMVHISDDINSYVLHPSSIDDNMLQDMNEAFSKHRKEPVIVPSKKDEAFSQDEEADDWSKEYDLLEYNLFISSSILKFDMRFRDFLEGIAKSKLFETITPDVRLGLGVDRGKTSPYFLEVTNGRRHFCLNPAIPGRIDKEIDSLEMKKVLECHYDGLCN